MRLFRIINHQKCGVCRKCDYHKNFAVNANSKKIQFPAKFNYGWYKPLILSIRIRVGCNDMTDL